MHKLDHLPYNWQFQKQDGSWMDLFDAKEIEQNYCNCEDAIDYEYMILDFDDMVWLKDNVICGKIRRLNTEAQMDIPKGFKYHIAWNWFWQDESVWIMFDGKNGYPSSSEIERAFQEDHKIPFYFKTKQWMYSIDFVKMIQINIYANTSRKLRRRPEYFDEMTIKPDNSDSNGSRTKGCQKGTDFLIHQKNIHQSEKSFILMKLLHADPEFPTIQKIFGKTMPIKCLNKIHNNLLWEKFKMKLSALESLGECHSRVKYLFYGTQKQYVETICQQGFDTSSIGDMGCNKGIHFSNDSKYFVNNLHCEIIFMARVIIGKYIEGMNYQHCSLKNDGTKGPHESFVDNQSDPLVYVVFDNSQAYPEYLIEF